MMYSEMNYKKQKAAGFWFSQKNKIFERPSRQAQSLLAQDPKGIRLLISQKGVEQFAEVIIYHIDFTTYNFSDYIRLIKGPHTEVLQETLKILKKDYQKDFLHNWDRTVYNLYSKNLASIERIDLPKNDDKPNYGPFNIVSSGELLKKKIAESEKINNVEQLAALTGINTATIYRQIDGSEIGRNQALKYAQALGCDPIDLLFNPIYLQTWGNVNTAEMVKSKDHVFVPGQIYPVFTADTILCPREIYRYDVKAIKLTYENLYAFVYHSIQQGCKTGELVVVGISRGKEQHYYFGYLEKNKDQTINIKQYNPHSTKLSTMPFADEDKKASYVEAIDLNDAMQYVVVQEKPDFIATVVSVSNAERIENNLKRSKLAPNLEANDFKAAGAHKWSKDFGKALNHALSKNKYLDLEKRIDKFLSNEKTYYKKADFVLTPSILKKYPQFKKLADVRIKNTSGISSLLAEDYLGKKEIDEIFAKGKDMRIYDVDYLFNKYGKENYYLKEKFKQSHWWSKDMILVPALYADHKKADPDDIVEFEVPEDKKKA